MSDEQLEKLIDNFIHTNLYVLDNGVDNMHDYVVGGTDDFKRELLNVIKIYKQSQNV